MCEHMRARKLRLREFPARYAFRPLPCDDCDYVMQLPDLYMYAPSARLLCHRNPFGISVCRVGGNA